MSRLRSMGFILACLIAVGIAGAGLVYTNTQALTVAARSAQLTTETYRLGTPYGGTIQDIRIQRGDAVTQGEELFSLQSPTLQAAMQQATFSSARVGYRIEPGGIMVFTAARTGIVQSVTAKIGSFIKADATIAQIAIADTLHLQATFSLDARDYARIPRDGDVTVAMPDGTAVDARIYDVQVGSYTNGRASTTILARSTRIDLKDYSLVGAPVAADLHLVDDSGPGTWIGAELGKLFTPGGFGT